MKRTFAWILSLFCFLALAGCGIAHTESDYPAAIMVEGEIYLKSVMVMPTEIDESAIIGYTTSYTDTYPEKDGETNFSRELHLPYARVEDGIAILCENEWYLCTRFIPKDTTETVSFHDKTFEKSELSEETLAWLEWYNGLSEEEQLAVSYIPHDLYDLCGYGEAEDITVHDAAE